ncbi:MAG: hypothetical protein QXP98_04810 [Thermoproteus sp.]
MCEIYWDLLKRGVEVLGGLLGWARAFGCDIDLNCECDVVIAERDAQKAPTSPCVWTIDEVGFSHRRVWLGGIPHVSLEDLPKIKSPYTKAVLDCITDVLRRRGASDRPQQEV